MLPTLVKELAFNNLELLSCACSHLISSLRKSHSITSLILTVRSWHLIAPIRVALTSHGTSWSLLVRFLELDLPLSLVHQMSRNRLLNLIIVTLHRSGFLVLRLHEQNGTYHPFSSCHVARSVCIAEFYT